MSRLIRVFSVLTLLTTFTTFSALAADKLITTHRIPAALAFEAVSEVVKSCAAKGYNESAVLVDAGGNQQAALRGDGAGLATLENADHKAYTAVAYMTDTHSLVDRAKTGSEMSPALNRLPHLILAQGGMIIKVGDEVIGAIGASGAPGGDKDDSCARAGIAKIQDRLK